MIAGKVIQLDRLLRRYGLEADGLRDLLRRYTTMKIPGPVSSGQG
jgi:hypothetical protein